MRMDNIKKSPKPGKDNLQKNASKTKDASSMPVSFTVKEIIQRFQNDSKSLTQQDFLTLHQTIGNQAVIKLMSSANSSYPQFGAANSQLTQRKSETANPLVIQRAIKKNVDLAGLRGAWEQDREMWGSWDEMTRLNWMLDKSGLRSDDKFDYDVGDLKASVRGQTEKGWRKGEWKGKPKITMSKGNIAAISDLASLETVVSTIGHEHIHGELAWRDSKRNPDTRSDEEIQAYSWQLFGEDAPSLTPQDYYGRMVSLMTYYRMAKKGLVTKLFADVNKLVHTNMGEANTQKENENTAKPFFDGIKEQGKGIYKKAADTLEKKKEKEYVKGEDKAKKLEG